MTSAKPFLWFASGAEEATRLYTSLIDDSAINEIERIDVPGGEVVSIIQFRLGGTEYTAMDANGAPGATDSYSFTVTCSTQEELDRIWDALIADGGEPVQCGWLRDKWGFSWQINPARMDELMKSGNPAQRNAVMAAMMEMVKLDVAGLEAAYASASSS
ncbi:MAG: VOC family protein [Armatimonadetes bacterium]|nr:VOC family protein [Armatimonadota bacterium]